MSDTQAQRNSHSEVAAELESLRERVAQFVALLQEDITEDELASHPVQSGDHPAANPRSRSRRAPGWRDSVQQFNVDINIGFDTVRQKVIELESQTIAEATDPGRKSDEPSRPPTKHPSSDRTAETNKTYDNETNKTAETNETNDNNMADTAETTTSNALRRSARHQEALEKQRVEVIYSRDEGFLVDVGNLGHDMPRNLEDLTQREGFGGIGKVIGLPELDLQARLEKVDIPREGEDISAVKWAKAKRHSFGPTLCIGKLEELDGPVSKFTKSPAQPSPQPQPQEVIDFLESMAGEPPTKKTLPYYVGPPLDDVIDTDLSAGGAAGQFLYPGQTLHDLGNAPGINTHYWHLGEAGSGTAFHKEDGSLRSVNLTVCGWKIWLLVDPSSSVDLERLYFGDKGIECDQSVRHASQVISPRYLQDRGIKFRVICAGPGDLVVTQPNEYHYVINYTASFALAVNFLFDHDDIFPTATKVCRLCGTYGLEHENLTKLSPGKRKRSDRGFVREKTPDSIIREARQTMVRFIERDEFSRPLPDEAMQLVREPEDAKMAVAVLGSVAITQFQGLVTAWRSQGLPNEGLTAQDDMTPIPERLVRRAGLLQRRGQTLALNELLYALSCYDQAVDVDALIPTKKAYLPRHTLQPILEAAKCSKSSFYRHITLGRQFRRMTSDNPGLLCFIPLTKVSGLDQTLRGYGSHFGEGGDRPTLFDLLQHDERTAVMIQAGNAFIRSLRAGASDVRFRWEVPDAMPPKDLETLEAFILPEPPLTRDLFDVAKFAGSMVPEGWPDDIPWPSHPLAVHPGRGCGWCDLCHGDEGECVCRSDIDRAIGSRPPRIKLNTEGTLGVFAVGSGTAEVVYRKNNPIGVLHGELLPVATGGGLATMRRPDLEEGVEVCRFRVTPRSGILQDLRATPENQNVSWKLVPIDGVYENVLMAEDDIVHDDELLLCYDPGRQDEQVSDLEEEDSSDGGPESEVEDPSGQAVEKDQRGIDEGEGDSDDGDGGSGSDLEDAFEGGDMSDSPRTRRQRTV